MDASLALSLAHEGNGLLDERLQRLKRREIICLYDPKYKPTVAIDPLASRTPTSSEGLGKFPEDVRYLCAFGHFKKSEEERAYFHAMHTRLARVQHLVSQMENEGVDERALQECEQCLEEADSIRNTIIEANMRLVVSLANKFASSEESETKVSTGSMGLMDAVERFDYMRGVRFSTYAHPAITRALIKERTSTFRSNARFQTHDDPTQLAEMNPDDSRPQEIDDLLAIVRAELETAIQELDLRLQCILNKRFLDAYGTKKSMPLEELGEELGISKERVRQLQGRALAHLRKIMQERLERRVCLHAIPWHLEKHPIVAFLHDVLSLNGTP